MKTKFRFVWARLTANYWFYPALFSIVAAVLAFVLVWLDRTGATAWLNNVEWLIPARPGGASDMLTVMAGSLIGVTSTVFSITLVAVTFASGNFGPRLITNFLEDRGNQVSLATFIGSFVYALIVLRSVRAEDETAMGAAGSEIVPGFVPQLSLLVAYGLMALSIAVLVFFLNHIPSSIRVNTVLRGIGERLLDTVRTTYPVEDEFADAREQIKGTAIGADTTGYVQLIDFAELVEIAQEIECIFSLKVRTGDFVHRDMALLEVSGKLDGPPDEALMDRIRPCFTLGPSRTPEQDPQFLIDELVEIGLRALSPGINDPFTAITALHWLGAATSEIGRRDLRKQIGDEDTSPDECPVIPLPDDFSHYVKRGFGAIRSGVATSPIAAEVMLDTLANAAGPIGDEKRSAMLRAEGKHLVEQARLALTGPDLDRFENHAAQFERTFWDRG